MRTVPRAPTTVLAALFAVLFATLMLAPAIPPAGADEAAGRVYEPLQLETADGRRHAFRVEIADEDGEHARGLMFRRTLAPDAGMLFLFPDDRVQAFWMKNTYVPLDMLFVAADGRIADLHENAWPLDETPIRSDRPVRAVLEVVAGTVRRLGIRVGDRVLHRAF